MLGVPADATLELVESGPATAQVVLGGTTTIDGQSPFTIHIRKLKSPLAAAEPGGRRLPHQRAGGAAAPLLGPLDLVNGFTFTGTTTIPSLTGCGLATPLLNALMAGPNNPFSVGIAPPAGRA